MSAKEGSVVALDQSRGHVIVDHEEDTSSELSDGEHFLTKGAFLLTPANDLQMERIGMVCEKMNYKGPFSLTKTATGMLFKFAEPEDYQLTFKKTFHKVTGSRFYKKVPIPCRPQKTFTIFVFEIPEEIPEDDIRHSLYKFSTIVEVCRLPQNQSSTGIVSTTAGGLKSLEKSSHATGEISCVTSSGCVTTNSSPPPIVRITLASLEECNALLRDGLDFYGATFFPTEPALATSVSRAGGKKTVMHNSRLLDLIATSGLRIRDFLPVFDSGGFSRIPTPITKTVHSRP